MRCEDARVLLCVTSVSTVAAVPRDDNGLCYDMSSVAHAPTLLASAPHSPCLPDRIWILQ